MNSSRLFVLGSLERGGPMHGHKIRRAAQIDRTELWTDIKPGSLYSALHRMETEGVITAVRTEQEGNRPARTIYAITDAGRAELAAHRDKALRNTRLRPDPFDLALQYADNLRLDELQAIFEERQRAFKSELTSWQRLRASADPYLTELEKLTIRHSLLRLEAELAWHGELLEGLPTLLAHDTVSNPDEHQDHVESEQ